MHENPWQTVLDTLYNMGGKGEHPSDDTDQPLDSDDNLVQQTDLSNEGIKTASKTLQNMGLAESNTIGLYEDGEPVRYLIELTGEGYSFAHERQQEKRNIRSNRSVALLTVVLAFVGMAQAMALTAQVSDSVTGTISLITTVTAGVILLVIYTQLARSGVLDSLDLNE
ncbi:hypothetical protein EGH24_04765 [Halonotius terrestris]|uniref:Uncharacterized protein n=1 Tax=Halonotius terrestris TaxID=2487750 RepID=A0A8J8TC31_9EURY|nr:hypothetical protein [Halonotius terrestris]TQQ82757.1 hypothetical protein EGH24_04765 [Halonotius terrestris]